MSANNKPLNLVERKGVFALTLWPGCQFEKQMGTFDGIESVWEVLNDQGFKTKVLPKPAELAKSLLNQGFYESKFIAVELLHLRLIRSSKLLNSKSQ